MTYKQMKAFRIYLEGKGIPLCFLTVSEYAKIWNQYKRIYSV